jgi:hypothetical protein
MHRNINTGFLILVAALVSGATLALLVVDSLQHAEVAHATPEPCEPRSCPATLAALDMP